MTLPAAIADSTDQNAWHAARAEHVTASEIHTIAAGGRSTWRRILDDKLNGSTFTGNAHTERGHEREPFLIAAAQDYLGSEDFRVEPNTALYVAEDGICGATPDGVGTWFHISNDYAKATHFGVECKSFTNGRAGWGKAQADQVQLGMHVLDVDRWLVVIETVGDELDPDIFWVARDQERIDYLVGKAIEFHEWREAGAPDASVADETAAVVEPWLEAKAAVEAATARLKEAEKPLRQHIERHKGALEHGWRVEGESGGFNYSVTHSEVLDETAWSEAEPDGYANVIELRRALAAAEAAAKVLYTKPKTTTRLLPVYPEPEAMSR